jgi:hypothetical protein
VKALSCAARTSMRSRSPPRMYRKRGVN